VYWRVKRNRNVTVSLQFHFRFISFRLMSSLRVPWQHVILSPTPKLHRGYRQSRHSPKQAVTVFGAADSLISLENAVGSRLQSISRNRTLAEYRVSCRRDCTALPESYRCLENVTDESEIDRLLILSDYCYRNEQSDAERSIIDTNCRCQTVQLPVITDLNEHASDMRITE
jgi:hypothetical protein